MGYIRHHAIVVTSWEQSALEAALVQASVCGLTHTGIGAQVTNGFRSFLVCPDGGKEGWEMSDHGDERREQFKAWLRGQRHEDGSSALEWVEVCYGDDDYGAVVTDGEWTTEAAA